MKINYRYKLTAGIVICCAFTALIVRLVVFPELTWDFQIKAFFGSAFVFSVIASIYFFINNTLDKVYPFEKGVALRIVIQLVVGVGILFTVHGIAFGVFRDRIPVQLDRVFITAVFILDFFAGLAINFMFFTEYFFKQWKLSFQRAEKLEREKTMVQYDNLKNQLNPHFLFNALTSLNSLIYENQDQASQFLKQLSRVYRYLLENNEVVTLRKELDFLENYISLLKTRFGNSLLIRIDVEERIKDHRLVPVTLQNLLENALKHNSLMPDKPLHIRIYNENEYICVENSLQRKSIVENSNKQGLLNLKNLYRYLDSREVIITENQEKFIVKVPLI